MQLPDDILSRSDDAAGRALLECWVQYQAEKTGVHLTPFAAPWMASLVATVGPAIATAMSSRIEQAIRQAIVAATTRMETDDIKKMPVVTALKLAAKGEFARAGGILKQRIGAAGPRIVTDWLAEVGKHALVNRKARAAAAPRSALKRKSAGHNVRTRLEKWEREQGIRLTPQSHVDHIVLCTQKIGCTEVTLRNELYRRAREKKPPRRGG